MNALQVDRAVSQAALSAGSGNTSECSVPAGLRQRHWKYGAATASPGGQGPPSHRNSMPLLNAPLQGTWHPSYPDPLHPAISRKSATSRERMPRESKHGDASKAISQSQTRKK